MTIKTYPAMNAKTVEILRLHGERHLTLYAAQRIKELETEVEQLQRELHDEQIRHSEWEKMYNQAIACGDTRSTLAEIEQLRDSLEAILDEATSDHDRDIIITECQSALKPKPKENAE